jgi:hypothetical protein
VSQGALILNLKRIYFEQIRSGEKLREFRLRTPYWRKRLEGKSFSHVEICLGYPKATDRSRRLIFPWRGYEEISLVHPHFGEEPVEVFAIILG